MAMESVLEDLEGLSASARWAGDGGEASGGGDAADASCDEESLRIDDLAPPLPQRAAYEQETAQPTARCEDFELVDPSALEGDDEESQSWVLVAHSSSPWTG